MVTQIRWDKSCSANCLLRLWSTTLVGRWQRPSRVMGYSLYPPQQATPPRAHNTFHITIPHVEMWKLLESKVQQIALFLKEMVSLSVVQPLIIRFSLIQPFFVRFSTRTHSNVTTEREVLMCEICQALLCADVIRWGSNGKYVKYSGIS